jgi:fatty-acyl-CoA synthase
MSNDTPSGPCLWDRLTHGRADASLHCWMGDGYRTSPWREVMRGGEAMTAGLRNAGVRTGTRVAAVLTNGPQVVRGLLGAWLAGAAVASLPVPARGMSRDEYLQQLAAILAQVNPVLMLVDQRMLGIFPDHLQAKFDIRCWESFADTGRIDPAPPADDELAFIQYSSGSTSVPKGCALSPRAIAAQLDIIADIIDVRPGRDVGVTWLPLSHDMGLFGCLLTGWSNAIEVYLSTPERFMFAPGTWFSELAQTGATLSAGTNASLYLAARSARRMRGIRAQGLSSVRHCIIGAERVEWNTVQFAIDALSPFGLRPAALTTAYGLAEATLAVTAKPQSEQPRRLAVDSAALADGVVREVAFDDPAATSIVSAGAPCTGVTLDMSCDGRLAEIVVRSPSLAMGYWANEVKAKSVFRDGALYTSDLGFVRDGHLYPVGRVDDVISVAGRKVYAREIETAVDRIDGVRPGCSTLVGHHNGAAQRLTLFIELTGKRNDFHAVADMAAALAMEKAAIGLDECIFLDRDSLPKTPSGKIQRHRCRSLFEAGQLKPLATVELARG